MSMSIQAEQALDIPAEQDEPCEASPASLRRVNSAPALMTRGRRLAERGLTTVEYAIGLVAAAAAALVLLRIFNDNAFFKALFDWVVNIFTSLAGA